MRKSSLLAVSRAVAVGLIKRAGRCATALILFASFVNAVHGQTAHFAGTETSIGSGYASPHGVAIDSKGNVFVADTYNNLVKEIVAVNGSIPPSPSIRILGSGFSFPWSIAVDASGNVFVADWGNGAIKEIQAVNGSIPDSPVIATLVNVNSPVGVALDSAANVYYTDTEYGLIKEILHSTGYASVVTLATEFWNGSEWVFMHLGGLAVDSSGDVFATDSADNAVYEIVAVNGSIPPSPSIRLVAGGFNNPEGLAVDGNGNIVVADYNNNVIKEVLAVNGSIPSSPTVISLGYGLHYPSGVAVDAAGDVLIADTGNSRAVEETISSVTYGSIGVGITSNAAQLTFAFDTAGTLGSTSVVTQGATGLDFSNAGTGSCAANTAYSAGQSCTVNVSFTPLFPGSRSGAVEINDSNGNVMATALLQGTGVGPQLSFSPGTQTTLGSSFSYAAGIAVDGSGNAYVVDVINNLGNVQEVMAVNGRIPANPTVRTLVGNLDCPIGPALDAAGNVYFADVCYHTVNEIQAVNGTIPSSPTIRTLTSQFTSPDGIAVDSRGNVYVLDASNKTVNEIFAANGSIPASPTIATLASGFKELDGIAVDGNGNIYVSDDSSRAVFEIHAVNGSIPTSPLVTSLGSGFVIPRGISVDASGNVYVAEYFYNTVYKILAVNGSIPASPTIQTLGAGLLYANGVSVDANRNVFVADYGDARLVRLDYGDPPSLSFASTPLGTTSSDSPQTITLENVGNADLNFPIPANGNNPSISANFTLDENAPSACTVTGSGSSTAGVLAAGTSCVLPIGFDPTVAGSISGSLVLIDNNLNAAGPTYATQSISLSGSSTSATPAITWSAPGTITYGTALSSAQLNATASVPGTFSYSPAAGTVLSVGAHTLNVTFTPTDSTDYTTATASVPLTVNKATPVITWLAPAPIVYGTALSATQLNARANVPGTFAYTPAAGTILPVGTNTLNVVFTPSDTTDYTTANASVTLVVNPAPSYTLTASPSSLSVKQGNKAGSTISVNATNGFTGAVSLSVSGLPKNVTATFSPNPATKTSTVTFTASNGASLGNSLLTITGKSGSLVQTTTITLTVVHK